MERRERNEIEGLEFVANYLGALNLGDNAERLARHVECVERGEMTVNELFACCNELGECVYEGVDDPNALVNRFPSLRGEFGDSEGGFITHFDGNYYVPSLENIVATRQKYEWQEEAKKNPPVVMEGHEDFVRYFESFSPEALAYLFEQTEAIQLQMGCAGPCLDLCYLPVLKGRLDEKIPFKTVEWIFREHGASLEKGGKIIPNFASDIKFYRDIQQDGTVRDGVDVLALYAEVFNQLPYVSTVFGTDKKFTIPFLGEMILKCGGIPHRISNLVGNPSHEDIEKLILGVVDYVFDKTKLSLANEVVDDLYAAIMNGRKTGGLDTMDTFQGTAAQNFEEESDIATDVVHCFHGVVLKPDGFWAVEGRPTSAVFPGGIVTWPIKPGMQMSIPRGFDYASNYAPYTLERYVAAPDILKISNGEEFSFDSAFKREKSPLEFYKTNLQYFRAFEKQSLYGFTQHYKGIYKDLLESGELDEVRNFLDQLSNYLESYVMQMLSLFNLRDRAIRAETDDRLVLTELFSFDAHLERVIWGGLKETVQLIIDCFNELKRLDLMDDDLASKACYFVDLFMKTMIPMNGAVEKCRSTFGPHVSLMEETKVEIKKTFCEADRQKIFALAQPIELLKPMDDEQLNSFCKSFFRYE